MDAKERYIGWWEADNRRERLSAAAVCTRQLTAPLGRFLPLEAGSIGARSQRRVVRRTLQRNVRFLEATVDRGRFGR